MVKYVSSFCHSQDNCGGFGDRIRGSISAFFIALCTGRALRISWRRGANLNDYFNINEQMYNVSKQEFERSITVQNENDIQRVIFIDSGMEGNLLKWSAQTNFSDHLKDYVSIRTNSMAAIEGTLRNPDFTQFYSSMVIGGSSDQNQVFDMSVFVSAALKIILSQPNDLLRQTFNKCVVQVVGEETWRNSFRIGVQIRMLNQNWNEYGIRVTEAKIPCFSEAVNFIMKLENIQNSTNTLVFFTSDSDGAYTTFKDALAQCCPAVKVVDTNAICSDVLHSGHLERSSNQNTWMSRAKTFVDWLALTEMHRLIISRSGFAEMASFYSLQPTLRFAHWIQNQTCPFQPFNIVGPTIAME